MQFQQLEVSFSSKVVEFIVYVQAFLFESNHQPDAFLSPIQYHSLFIECLRDSLNIFEEYRFSCFQIFGP